MPKKASPAAIKAIKKINKRAAELRKEHPRMTQREAIKRASAEYRKSKKQ